MPFEMGTFVFDTQSRYLWALLILRSMLDLFISVIPPPIKASFNPSTIPTRDVE